MLGDHVMWLGIAVFFFNDTATTEIYTLSLHDALPISWRPRPPWPAPCRARCRRRHPSDRKSTRLNSSHVRISYAVFCLKKKIFQPHSVLSHSRQRRALIHHQQEFSNALEVSIKSHERL